MLNESVLIRDCARGDIPAITAIYAAAVLDGTASFEIDPPDEAEMKRRWETLAGAYPFLIAEEKGCVLGYAYAGPYRPRPAYRWTVEDSVYLSEGSRGRGVGLALLTRLIAEAERLGYRQMIAIIGDSETTASISLHKRAGFAHAGTFRNIGFKKGRWLDSVLMQRALGSGALTTP